MTPAEQQAFVATYGPIAQDIAKVTGLDPTVVLGQVAQETGWGKHVSGNNIFGISPNGPNGQYVAQYPDVGTAGQAYADLMRSPRYAAAATVADPAQQAVAITRAGYNSVDPTYAQSVATLANTVRQIGLPGAAPAMPVAQADPDEAAGEALIQSMMKGPAQPQSAPTQYQTVAPHPAPDGSGMTNLSDADFARFNAPAHPAANANPAPSAPAATEMPTDPDIAAGQSAVQAITKLAPPPAAPPVNGGGEVDTVAPGLRTALAPAPNTTYGNVIPFARDDTTGAVRLAMPTSLRDLATGFLDLAEGPATGTVTPQGTMALMSGLAPGVMRGAPVNVAGAAARLDPVTGRGFTFAPKPEVVAPAVAPRVEPRIVPVPPANALAAPPPYVPNPLASAVNAPAFVPPGAGTPILPRILDLIRADDAVGSTRPEFVPPSAPQPPNPLATPPAVVPPGSVRNPLATGAPSVAPVADPAAQAIQATTELQRLSTPAPTVADRTQYVPGVRLTAADAAAKPEVSLQQKTIRQANDTPFTAIDQANNTARMEHYDNLAGTPTTTQALIAARDEQATKDLSAAFSAKTPADAQPVVAQIDGILNSRVGKLPPVVDAMQKALAPLYDADGKLETDPELLYGARQNIGYLMSKTAQQEKPGLREATAQLGQVKAALDSAIEQAAPGYRQYLANYAAASKPIDVQELLQTARPNLVDAAGNMQLSRVQSLMKQIVHQRQAGGVNPAKSIDPETMEGLWNLRSDLLRQATNRSLGKPSGSDTHQLMTYANKAGEVAAHGLAAHMMPVVGNALVHYGVSTLKQKNIARQTEKFLNPDLRGYSDFGKK